MDKEVKEVLDEIEKLRIHLQDLLTKSRGFQDPELLAVSNSMDELINRYHGLLKERKTHKN